MEMKSRVIGVESQMKSFAYLFGLRFSERIVIPFDNLSKTPEKGDMTVSEGERVAEPTVEIFISFLSEMTTHLTALHCPKEYEIDDPVLLRARERPRRFDENPGNTHFSADVKSYYKQHIMHPF